MINVTVKFKFKIKLIVKVPVVGNTADTPNPPGLLPTDQRIARIESKQAPKGSKQIL